MKKYLLLAVVGLHLGACKKDDATNQNTAPVAAAFDQSFSLHDQQQALLPAFSNPELTIALKDLQYTYCPPNLNCLVGTFVSPTLSITDALGVNQQLTLPLVRPRVYNPAWIDTASVRANGRRYVVYYTKWEIGPFKNSPAKKDISVQLRVTRPN